MTDENKIDFWGDGIRIFLDYVNRQLRKNPDYSPHPLVRALELAVINIDKVEIGQNVMGMSQDGTKDSIHNPYIVIAHKANDGGIEIDEIRNLSVNKELPLDIMIIIFRLQISLDKITGEVVSPDEMVNCLNSVIPGDHFYALGDRWKEARDAFKVSLEQGKISVPKSSHTEELLDELIGIKHDTPWEDYSPGARSLIGSHIKLSLGEKTPSAIITTPKNYKIEKYKVFDMATEFLLGKSAEYMNLLKKDDKSSVK
jgi:hypothetical protein